MNRNEIVTGDALTVLRTWPDGCIDCCVTSPPYFGLRDYGTADWDGGDAECDHQPPKEWIDSNINASSGLSGGFEGQGKSAANRWYVDGACRSCGAKRIDKQLGLEATPAEFVARMVELFREVRRVLKDDGTLWLNLGDSYSSGGRTTQVAPTLRTASKDAASGKQAYLNNFAVRPGAAGKPKDLLGIPWRVAFALQDDGWYLRQDIIWHKPNPMPESVTDRCTKAHEYIFLLSKSARYYYDADAIKETSETSGGARNGTGSGVYKLQEGLNKKWDADTRNKRSVWTVNPKPYKGAHFATFPPELIKPCILAGCREGGVVLDPFMGSGTVAYVARKNRCDYAGIELNPDYVELANKRLAQKVLF